MKKIYNLKPKVKTSSTKTNQTNSDKLLLGEDRVKTADYILKIIRQRNNLNEIVNTMEIVADAYIELANLTVTPSNNSNSNGNIPFNKSLLINKLKNLTAVNILTVECKINRSAIYNSNDLISLVKYEPNFKLASGVNLPKVTFKDHLSFLINN
jgi:hypothetical protein